jgi:predicted RNase H-like HicB family nuclease
MRVENVRVELAVCHGFVVSACDFLDVYDHGLGRVCAFINLKIAHNLLLGIVLQNMEKRGFVFL